MFTQVIQYLHVNNCPNAISGTCQLLQAVKGDIDVLLNGVGDKGVIVDVKHILVMVLNPDKLLLTC